MRQTSLRFLIFIFTCILLAMMALACATMQERSEAKPAANLVISPNSGPPASAIHILGSGFIPGEKFRKMMADEHAMVRQFMKNVPPEKR